MRPCKCKLRLVYGILEAKVKRLGVEMGKKRVKVRLGTVSETAAREKRRILKIVAAVFRRHACFLE